LISPVFFLWRDSSWPQSLLDFSTHILEASFLGGEGGNLEDTLGLLIKFVWGRPSQCGVPSDCFSLFYGEIMTNTGHLLWVIYYSRGFLKSSICRHSSG
jgi:hypothetical protein